MKKMFIASYFKQVASILPDFLDQDINGKTVTFIPTASNYEKIKFFVESDKKALIKLGLQIDELDIEKATIKDCRRKLEKNDFIFICGGNTFFLLQEIMHKEIDTSLKKLIENGKPYISTSAGSVIMSPDIEFIKLMDDPKQGNKLKSYNGLNMIDSYVLPHYNNFPFKKIGERIVSEFGEKVNLLPISNNQVIEVVGNKLEVLTKEKK